MVHRNRFQHVLLALNRSSDRQHWLHRLRYQHVSLALGRPPGRQHPLLRPAVVNFGPLPLPASPPARADRQRHHRHRKPRLRVVCQMIVKRCRCRQKCRSKHPCHQLKFARLSLRGRGLILWKLVGQAHDNDRSTTIGGQSKPLPSRTSRGGRPQRALSILELHSHAIDRHKVVSFKQRSPVASRSCGIIHANTKLASQDRSVFDGRCIWNRKPSGGPHTCGCCWR